MPVFKSRYCEASVFGLSAGPAHTMASLSRYSPCRVISSGESSSLCRFRCSSPKARRRSAAILGVLSYVVASMSNITKITNRLIENGEQYDRDRRDGDSVTVE